MTKTDRNEPAAPAVGLPLDGGVRQRAQYVDAVMRAVYAMLRSAPNFDGSIGDVERAVWEALNADSDAANKLAESRLEQMNADREQALRWRDQLDRALTVCRCAVRVVESSAYQGVSDEDCDLEHAVRHWQASWPNGRSERLP
jgi:hypothetical protein